MKRLLSLLAFTFLFSIIFTSAASALENESHSHDDEVTPYYIPCPAGGKHQMTARGRGQVPLSNGKIYFHNLYQCKSCSHGIVSVNSYYGALKPSVPGEYVAVSLPHQAMYGYDFTKKGVTYKLSYSKSYTSGLFASMAFVY